MTAAGRVLTAALLPLVAVPVAAQQPRLINGRLETHAVTGGLLRDFQAVVAHLAQPTWIGYAAPVAESDNFMCDGSYNVRYSSTTAPVHLEPSTLFFVLYRVEQGQVVRIRSYSEDCPLDAGGKAVHWFTGVSATDSLALLGTFITPAATNRMADGAVSAIAMHAGAPALDTLVGLARDNASPKVRGQALFWLGQRAGQKAVGTITAAMEQDPDTEVKKKAVFALSQLPKDEGVPLLIQAARTNKNPAVRKQAMFWLGQSKDPRALKFFEEVLQR